MSLTANNNNSLTEIESIINESGQKNFSRKQGSWGSFEKRCSLLTNCGWKMGMCKSVSGKDNAINRLYTTGVIRSYPENLIQCLFVDDFVDEISAVYRTEFGMKMRCSPILMIVKIKNIEASREHLYPNVYARFMYLVSIKDIKNGEELAANYNLYTYPKTGIGFQTF